MTRGRTTPCSWSPSAGRRGPTDVVPFLENVTARTRHPRERLEEVGRALLPVRWPQPDQRPEPRAARRARGGLRGQRARPAGLLGQPQLGPVPDATRSADEGRRPRRAACLVTSAYASYSGCRQYRENLAAAAAEVRRAPRALDRLRHYFNHPGFVEPMVDATLAALAELPGAPARRAHLAFVTHSIPRAMNELQRPDRGRAYVAQHRRRRRRSPSAVRAGDRHRYPSSWSSAPGPGRRTSPWLEPDVNDHLGELAGDGCAGVVVVPIGFVSDHMEVIYDLDTEAGGDRRGARSAVRARRDGRRRPAVRGDGSVAVRGR